MSCPRHMPFFSFQTLPSPWDLFLAMVCTSGDETVGDAGMLFDPGKECLPGDPDAAAEAADREILAVGQLIGLRLADVQIPANIGNSEILILQNIVTHNDLHNFVFLMGAGFCCFLAEVLHGASHLSFGYSKKRHAGSEPA